MAEAAKLRFPRALRLGYQEIEWDATSGRRDRLAHDDGSVDLDILAEVVDDDLPRLVIALTKILGEERPPT